MREVKAVVFDLDGTLTQSEEGIWNCVRHAVRCMGMEEPDAAEIRGAAAGLFLSGISGHDRGRGLAGNGFLPSAV